jgi:hypothetical protein
MGDNNNHDGPIFDADVVEDNTDVMEHDSRYERERRMDHDLRDERWQDDREDRER